MFTALPPRWPGPSRSQYKTPLSPLITFTILITALHYHHLKSKAKQSSHIYFLFIFSRLTVQAKTMAEEYKNASEEFKNVPEHESTPKVATTEEPSATTGEVKDRGLFDFLGKKEEVKPQETTTTTTLESEFEHKAQVSEPPAFVAKHEEEEEKEHKPTLLEKLHQKHEEEEEENKPSLLQKLHRSNSSSSVSNVYSAEMIFVGFETITKHMF